MLNCWLPQELFLLCCAIFVYQVKPQPGSLLAKYFFGLDQKKFILQGSIWIFCNSEARTDDTLTPGINVVPCCCCCVRFTVHTPGSQSQPHTPQLPVASPAGATNPPSYPKFHLSDQCHLPLNPCTAEMRAAHLQLLGVALAISSLSASKPQSPKSTADPESLTNSTVSSSEADDNQLERESRADLLSERQDGSLGVQFFGILSPERLRNAPRLQRFTELLRRPIRNLVPDSMRFRLPRVQQMNRQLNQIRSNIQQGAVRGMGRLQAIQRMPQEGLRGNLPFQGEGTRAIRNLGQRLQGMRLPQIPSPPRLQGLRLQRPNLQGLRLQRPNLPGLGRPRANPLQSLAQRMRLPQNSPLLALRERLQGLRRNTSKRLQRLQKLPPYLEEYEDFEAA